MSEGLKLYFRFKNAPLDREGGAWWDRTYYSDGYTPAAAQRAAFLETLKPFLAAWAFDSIDNEVLAEGEPPRVSPHIDETVDDTICLQESHERKRAYIENVIKPEFPLGARVRVIDSDERCYINAKGTVAAYSPGINGKWPGILVEFDENSEVPSTSDVFWFEELERLPAAPPRKGS